MMENKLSRRDFLARNGQRLAASFLLAPLFSVGCHSSRLSHWPQTSPWPDNSAGRLLHRLLPDQESFTITSGFGYRVHPITGKRHWHRGIDFALDPGTAIHAPGWGFVHRVFKNHKSGLTLLFDDYANGITWGMGHLLDVNTDEGHTCYAGTFLASSGGEPGHPNSGNSTGPHLHLTARVDGQLVDPAILLGIDI